MYLSGSSPQSASVELHCSTASKAQDRPVTAESARHARPHWAQSHILKSCRDRRTLAVSQKHLHELKLQVLGVELVEFGLRVRPARLEARHD